MMRGDTGARRGDGSVWGGQRGLGEVWGRSWDLGCSPLTPLIPHSPPGAGAAAAGAGGAADGAQHPGEVRPQPAPAPAPPALARRPLRQPRLPQHRRRRAGTPKHAPSRRGTPKPDPDTLTPFSRAPQYPQLPPPSVALVCACSTRISRETRWGVLNRPNFPAGHPDIFSAPRYCYQRPNIALIACDAP